MTFYTLLCQDFVVDFFEDLFDIDGIGYAATMTIFLIVIYVLWSVIGGILYYKWTRRIILPNLTSFVGYLASLIICELSDDLLDPTYSHGNLLWRKSVGL